MDVGQFDIRRDENVAAVKPLWAAEDYKTEEGFLKWAYQTLPILERMYQTRNYRMYNNLMWYTGEYDPNEEYRLAIPGRPQQPVQGSYIVNVVFNHLKEITEQRVSQLSLVKPTFDVSPHNRVETDRIKSRLMKQILDQLARRNRATTLFNELEKWNAIFGECPMFVEWDKGAGDVIGGKPQGDVSFYLKEPYWMLYEPKRRFDKVRFYFEIYDILHVDEVRRRWGVGENLQPDGLTSVWSYSNDGDREKATDELVVYRFVYKPDEFLPNGFEALFAGKEILEFNVDRYRYSHGGFPFVRHTDIDVPGRIVPLSFYHYLIPVQHQLNKMTSLMHRNLVLSAHPKWIMQKGTCDIKALGNAATVVEVSPNATIMPKLETFQSVPRDAFEYRNTVKDELKQLGGIQGVSMGDPPPNARAASIYSFLREEQQQRHGTQIDKRNTIIVDAFTMAGSVVRDYYPQQKDRIVRIVGRNNQFEVRALEDDSFTPNYEVIIQNSTGFSESKAGRMEEIGFVMEKLPGAMSLQQAADILELQQPQKFYDIVTAALKQAEYENQLFVDGEPVRDPEPQEDHISHWNTHRIWMQTEGFKELPERDKAEAISHMEKTEMLMEEAGVKSAAFASQLSQLPQWPIFYTPSPVDPKTMAQGQEGAPQGKPVGGPGPGRPPENEPAADAKALTEGGGSGNPASGPSKGNPVAPPM